MGRPLKIAVASRQVSGVTGTTTTILEQAGRLVALGWEVHVYGDDLDKGRILASGAMCHRLPRLPFGGYYKRLFFARLFERLIAREPYDLVCGHGDTLTQDVLSLHNCVHAAHEALSPGAPPPRLPESSTVGRLHGRILKERRFRLMIANSRLMQDDVVRRFGVPAERVRVIHPGHDPARFNAQGRAQGLAARRELGVGEQEFLIGVITSGDFKKRGVGAFLAALGRLPGALKAKLRALVVGSESRLDPYRRMAAEAGVETNFLRPRPDIERYYHALDVYVHPAHFEEFGQSVQEAMACGVPVLTTARVGAGELLTGPARELLLDRPEPEALSLAIRRILEDAPLRARLAAEGIAAVRGNTWDRNFESTLACYEEALREKKS